MAIHENIKQGVRDWLKQVNGLTDEQCILEREWDAERPDKPYLGLRLTSSGEPTFDESVNGIKNNNPSHKTHSGRTAVATVNGYGVQTADWMETAQQSLKNPKVRDALGNAGLTIRRMRNGLNDVTQLVGTGFESRYAVEFQIAYRLVSDEVETYPEVSTVDINLDLEDPQKDDTYEDDVVINT
ncbi:MAG: LIC_12616 family protein [Bradymonadaceae bacterium]